MSLDTFEQSLLNELRQLVVTRAGAAAVALSIATVVAGPSAAYAVASQPDGDVVVTVHDLSDAGGLQGALAANGISASFTRVAGSSQPGGQARTAGRKVLQARQLSAGLGTRPKGSTVEGRGGR